MLSALQHPSISNSASDSRPRLDPSLQKKAKINGDYEAHDMDYTIDDAPIHPLTPHPSSSSNSQRLHGSPTSSSITSFQPHQHQQLVKLKSEHEYSSPQQTSTPDIVMRRDDTDNVHPDQDRPPPNSVITQREPTEKESQQGSTHHPSHSENGNLVIDTSSETIPPLSSRPIASPVDSPTPTGAYLTPDSGITAPSSRRSSLRTMTATLPRSPLQVETIALFKQYKNLIPCVKCSSRNTIQRDGMSDGNLRFKCRPPVSMNITCGKSYSESKIRNMIANVVYGYSLPDSGTPASANGSLENVLAMAPPPSAKLGRRQSRKNEGPDVGTERLQQLRDIQEREQQQHREFGRENSMNPEHQQSYEEMNINGGHPHPVDDRTQGFAARRSSEQLQYRRASAVGDESMMMDYGEASMPPPSNHLQVLGTPPMESKDSHLYRSQSVYGNRSMSQSGSSSSLNSAIRKGVQKLHHSHSHPNIGQQRQQQFLEQQELQGREDRGIISGHGYPPQQQQQLQLQRQALRRESAQCHGSIQGRTETSERRFSHPAALQSAGRFLPSSSNAHSLSRRSSPGYEPRHQILEKVNIPYINQLPETGGQYDEAQYPALQYQRRMSQPHSGNRRPSNQLPPAPPGSHQYDRRASEAETFNYQHCEKHEKSNGSSMRHSANKVPVSPYSPAISHNDGSLAMPPQITKLQNGPLFRTLQPEDKGNYRYAYLRHRELSTSVYYQQPRRDYSNPTDPYAPDSLSAEEADDRTYARMRHIFKRANTGQSLARTSSRPNLYGASMSASKDLDSSMLRNSIKLTCFPNAISPANLTGRSPLSMKTDTPDAMAVNLARSSKIVIEITQSRDLQSFKPSRSSSFSAFENVPSPPIQQAQRSLRHTVSQSNLVARSTTSILGRRRSVSPDGLDLGSAKKRRADSISSSARDGEEGGLNSSASAAEAAAAAVVAAAASAARQQNSARESAVRLINTASPSGGLQIVGLDYLEEKRNESSKEIGLGVQVPSTLGVESPVIEALSVTKAPSYVLLEEQKELGIDYSLFTRVETATWRILIPPNVVASFRSEDFGLTLKPKLGVSTLDAEVAKLTLNKSDDSGEDNTGRAMDIEQVREEGKEIEPTEAKTYDKSITVKDGAVASAPEDQHEPTKDSEQCETIVDEISALKNAMEMEEVELVDE